jgi:hypothetical protein
MASDPPPNMLNEEVAFNLVTISAVVEYLDQKDPGAKEEIYRIGRRILNEHRLRSEESQAEE